MENTHWLTAVVVVISGIATCSGVEAVVHCKVTNLMVTGECFTGSTVVILYRVVTFISTKVNEVSVHVMYGCVIVCCESRCEKLSHHCETGILPVHGG